MWLNSEGMWSIEAEPHVYMKLKAVIPKIDKAQVGISLLMNTPENCRDLEWFLLRYPLRNENPKQLKRGADFYRKTLEDLERILLPDYAPKGVYKMVKPPRHYQIVSDQIYSRRKFLLNADDIGLGKTITGICSFTDPKKLPAVVVLEPHLQIQWIERIKEFIPTLKVHRIKSMKNYTLPTADVYIITYNKLFAWAKILSEFIQNAIYDEVQQLRVANKSEDKLSDKYAGSQYLNSRIEYKLGLSGSPIYNYGDEMFNIMDNLQGGCLGSRDEFLREWCSYQGRHYIVNDPQAFGTYLMENFLMIRRTAEDVGIELPEEIKTIQEVPYNERVLDEIKGDILQLARMVMAGKFGESGQAALEFDVKLRQQTGIAKAPFVAELCKDILDKGNKLVLVAWHREVWDIYMEVLKEFNPVGYTGTESPAAKQRSKSAFMSDDSQVLLLSLRSGTGLDGIQTVCNHIVHGELDYSPEVHKQCTGRLKRPGQTKSVISIFPIAEGGSDPFITNILGLKDSQSTGIMNPNKSNIFKGTVNTQRVKELAQYFTNKYGK